MKSTSPFPAVLVRLAGLWLFTLAGCPDDGGGPDPSRPELLTRRDAEPAGAHCALGGTAIHVGQDGDRDGVLDDEEIEHSEYVCDVPATLLREDELGPGEACSQGGTAVRIGIDDDGDGMLDDAEIDQTTYVCTELEIWDGDFTSNHWSDPASVAALSTARIVTGSLTIDVTTEVRLPRLELVNGNLVAAGNMPVLELPALRQVGGHVQLDTPAVDVLGFPVLERIVGELFVTGNGVNSESIGAPVLEEIGGRVVFWWGAKGVVAMPGLRRIGGDLALTGKLTALELDGLESIDGRLYYDDLMLPSIELPALRTVGGDLEVTFPDHLLKIVLPELERLGGTLRLSFVPGLHTVSLPQLQQIGGDLSIHNAAALTTLELSSLLEVGGRFVVVNAPALVTMPVGQLDSIGASDEMSILVNQTGLETLEFTRLRKTTGGIVFTDNAALRVLRFPALTEAYALSAGPSPSLEELGAPEVLRLEYFNLVESPMVAILDLGRLTSVKRHLDVRDGLLTDLHGLRSLRSAGQLFLYNLDALHDLSELTAIESVSSIRIVGNAALASLDGLDALTQLSGLLEIEQNPSLTSLDGLAHVTHVGLSVYVRFNSALADLGLHGLVSINGTLVIEFNEALFSAGQRVIHPAAG